MARRRRRSSARLSGSPNHHLKMAEREINASAAKYSLAAKFAKHGNCAAAFDAFVAGAAREGAAIAHDSESGLRLSVSATGKASDAYHAATKQFSAVCGVGGKLSGMRRKR